jgi:hypothetical protein
MTLQNHIHLMLPTQTMTTPEIHELWSFSVLGPTAGLVESPTKYIVHQRSLTGKSHIHRLVDDSGDPKLYNDLNHILSMITATKYNNLIDLSGTICYYIGIDHPTYVDGSEHTDPVQSGSWSVILLPITGVKPIDPSIQYRIMQIKLDMVT